MIVSNDDILWSASDLTRAAECEFSLLRQLDVKLGRISAAETAGDPLMDRIAEIGLEHEARELARLSEGLAPYDVATGGGVCLIDYPKPYTAAVLAERRDQTLEALEAGADLVCQAAFFDGSFHGFADFLIRDDDAYRVCDAKLSRNERPKALLQLAAYADQLAAAGIPLTDDVELLLGNGRHVRFPLSDLAPVFRERRQRLLDLLHGHQAAESPAEWGMPGVLARGRCNVCSEEVAAANDLLLVAGMRMTQRRKLIDAGITSVDQLAVATSPVDGMSASTFTTLHAQAALQVAGGTEDAPVTADVFCPDHLAVLPNPCPGDLFFDFEGDPMWNDGNPDWWGLEYLFGVTEVPEPGAESPFTPFWAHDRVQEKQALEDFIEFVRVRREKHPDLHIYHYAAYEKSALLRLAAKHATCEAAVDELLSAGVLVDLYAVVRGAIRVSAPSYSIKKLEPLYMGDDLREGEVTDAAASIVEYHAYCQARDSGDAEDAAQLLAEIRDYNRYDCESTRRLRDWLLERAAEHGVTPRAAEPEVTKPSELELTPLEVQLREGLPESGRTPDEQARAMLAAAIGYNRREHKPFWWAHFDRLSSALTDWRDERDVLVVESADVIEDWAKPTPRSSPHRHVRLVGHWGAGSVVRDGEQVSTVYADPVDGAHDVPANAALGCSRSGVVVVSRGHDLDGRDVLVVDETLTKDCAPYSQLPDAVVPGPPPGTGGIDAAVQELAEAVLARGLHPQPGLDVLRRTPPRLSRAGLPRGGDSVDDIFDAVRAVDRSYVAIQGPPGAGKTHVGSRVVARLVRDHGWKVGVVAQGHSVVEHMLDAIVQAGLPGTVVAKKVGDVGVARAWTGIKDSGYAKFLEDNTAGCVVGGTAWDFVNTKRIDRDSLDLLVIDEAGQFSLAHTLAVSVAAQRLLLLGDPQQLPQVSQGIHPEPVDDSALGWLIGEHATLPEDFGYFLDLTWRMHPDLAEKDSKLSYEGRLRAHPRTAERDLAGVEPGLRVVRLDHQDCSVESMEEADEVVRQVESLVGTPWTAPDLFEGTRPLIAEDFLVVAPYNAQVHAIRRALDERGLADVLVGTVDKLQGREAAVIIVSMTASSVADVPRGIDFLLDRNRVNVAISRGQWLAVLIRSGRLTQFMPTSATGLLQLGAFVGICED
jgi:predicted RecB family nuclease